MYTLRDSDYTNPTNHDQLYDQDFEKLRDECLRDGKLFLDPTFSPENSGLGEMKVSAKWKRPREIVHEPEFLIEGASRFDINQGQIADCWAVAAVASLTLQPQLFRRVVPLNQSFQNNYAGIFHFRFWRFGRWVDVVVDDQLPLAEDPNSLKFAHSSNKREFWISLFEKAYAKFYGSYAAISGGFSGKAFVDFTGGIVEENILLTEKVPSDLFQRMFQANNEHAIVVASIYTEKNGKTNLFGHHAYSVTDVAVLEYLKEGIAKVKRLVRVRNPWGVGIEWTGKWKDGGKEWNEVPADLKEELRVKVAGDGEFWMGYKKFIAHFDMVTICTVAGMKNADGVLQWKSKEFCGEWKIVEGRDGNRNSADFHENPQVFFSVGRSPTGSDQVKSSLPPFARQSVEKTLSTHFFGSKQKGEERKEEGKEKVYEKMKIKEMMDEVAENIEGDKPLDLSVPNDGKIAVLVALMGDTSNEGEDMIVLPTIAFDIFKIGDNHTPDKILPPEFFKTIRPVAKSNENIFYPEISGRLRLSPGNYCIVPYCYQRSWPPTTDEELLEGSEERKFNVIGKYLQRKFLLRVFVECA